MQVGVVNKAWEEQKQMPTISMRVCTHMPMTFEASFCAASAESSVITAVRNSSDFFRASWELTRSCFGSLSPSSTCTLHSLASGNGHAHLAMNRYHILMLDVAFGYQGGKMDRELSSLGGTCKGARWCWLGTAFSNSDYGLYIGNE
jgi:hypothetical protein